MRKILFASERVHSTSLETVRFIGVLVIFAILASSMVLYYGLQDKSRNRFKLALHCIMIVTSVVPPELPMELSLAVTNSLAALARGLVYCTEPFRIPLAGRLDVLCFDKTGTLTKDQMILRGVVVPQFIDISIDHTEPPGFDAANSNTSSIMTIFDPSMCPEIVHCIMASCHSLFENRGIVQGWLFFFSFLSFLIFSHSLKIR